MGKVRTCDSRCHNAKRAPCDCWCGGTFHGVKGAGARTVFREALGLEELGVLQDPDGRQGVLDYQGVRAAFAKAVKARRAVDDRPILETPGPA